MSMKIHNFSQGSAEWLSAARRSRHGKRSKRHDGSKQEDLSH